MRDCLWPSGTLIALRGITACAYHRGFSRNSYRLTENPEVSVAVLEAGRIIEDDPILEVPRRYFLVLFSYIPILILPPFQVLSEEQVAILSMTMLSRPFPKNMPQTASSLRLAARCSGDQLESTIWFGIVRSCKQG